MVTYFSENLKEDIVNCVAKWILVPWGLYNPYSGVTNNSAVSLNHNIKQFNEWKLCSIIFRSFSEFLLV